MGERRLCKRTLGMTLALLLMAGCGGPPPEPASTSAPVRPTATPTPEPPTATPTPAPPTATPTPEPPTATPTPEYRLATRIDDLVGTWHRPGKDLYLRFYQHGTLHHAHNGPDGDPHAVDQVRFEGTKMHIETFKVSGVPDCGDAIGIYEVRMFENGRIRVKAIEDDCSPRKRDTDTVFDMVPPTPTPPPATATPARQFTLASSASEAAGTYQKTVGAGCIRILEDGTFRQARRLEELDESPFAICEFEFKGTEMRVGECRVFGVPPCGVDAVYEIRLLEGGGIEMVALDDECQPRRLDTATIYHAVR